MAQQTGFFGVLDGLAGYYRDIEVARNSRSGEASTNVRPESIADQTAQGRTDEGGPRFDTPGTVKFAGLDFDRQILTVTAVLVGGLAAVRVLKLV